MAPQTLRWGILGPGSIARTFARGVAHSAHGEVVAVASRDATKPGLAEAFPGARVLDGYAALLADPEVDAVYIATPHPSHPEWAIRAAEAGKHVLVEKPMGLSLFEADAMFRAALAAGTFMGEAYMYRCHPQTQALIDLIASGTIGEVRLVKSSFGFAVGAAMPEHRLFANDLAGGGILDVGGYPVSMSRLIAGAGSGAPFLDPVEVAGVAHLGATGVDEWASAVLRFETGMIAEVSCSVSLAQDNVLRVFGTQGRIEVDDFWFAGGAEGGTGTIRVVRSDGSRDDVAVTEPRWLYSFEADAAAEAIFAGRHQFEAPAMAWDDSLGNLRTLDRWREAVGLTYAIETLERRSAIRGGRAGRRGERIPQGPIAGLDKPVSCLALGFIGFPTFSETSMLLDRYWEAGGNLFDTAWQYEYGRVERRLGDWLASRGVRDEAAVIGKGAHTPMCRPETIGRQLTETLERLQTDYVDIYLMHRDDPAVPVGEFVDAMDDEVRAGRIRGPFGGSNWTMDRLDAAVDYATRAGREAPQVMSNNFSLAEQVDPVWDGCVSSSNAEWRAWLADRPLTNLAWSSQSRGFFTERAGRDRLDDPELVRCWYSEANFARRDRAVELADELGVKPIHVALAYVLAQPFPQVALIGPLTLGELDDSCRALDITLTPDHLAWLEGSQGPT